MATFADDAPQPSTFALPGDAPQTSTFALPGDAPPRPSEAARRRFLEGLGHRGQRPLLFGELVVEKRGGELQMRERRGWCPGSAERGASTFWCLREADDIYRWPDFGPLSISTGDAGADGSLAFCHETPGAETVPDFVFHRWPEAGVDDFADTCAAIAAAGEKPAATDRAGWIGAPSHATRRRLAELGHSRPDLLSITLMTWQPETQTTGRHGASSFVSLPELVATYAWLVDVEGAGYSGRLKFLLFSKRCLLLADRPQKEWFHGDLVPWTHYVPVRRDLSDLVEKAAWCRAHPAAAAAVGAAAARFAEARLTRAACYARWDAVLRPYATPPA